MMKTGFYFIFLFYSFRDIVSRHPLVETIPVNSYMESNKSIIFQTISAPKFSNFRFLFFYFLLSKLNRLLQNKIKKLDVQPASPMCPAHPPATTTTTTDPSTTHVVFFLFSFLDPLGLTPSIDSRLLFSSGLLAVFPTPFVVSNFLLYIPPNLSGERKKKYSVIVLCALCCEPLLVICNFLGRCPGRHRLFEDGP